MGRNGHDQTADELKREADEHRRAIKQTAAELQDRLREKKEQVEHAIDRTRDKMSSVDDFIRRHRMALLGGVLGAGFILGVRRKKHGAAQAAAAKNGARYVLVEQKRGPSILRSLLGGLTALAARQGVAWLGDRLQGAEEYEERPLLTPKRPRDVTSDSLR